MGFPGGMCLCEISWLSIVFLSEKNNNNKQMKRDNIYYCEFI